MADPYTINLNEISLDRFQRMLATKDLLPGRMALRDQLDERFSALASMGISNVQELVDALKTKKRLSQFAVDSRLSEEYLTLLRREVNSYVAKPLKLGLLPGVDPHVIERLAQAQIKTTKHLFQRTLTAQQRQTICDEVDLSAETVDELARLSDLSRIVGIGPLSARLLLDAGIDSVDAFASATNQSLVDKLNQAIAQNPQLGLHQITIKDIVYCMETAQLLPRAIEFE